MDHRRTDGRASESVPYEKCDAADGARPRASVTYRRHRFAAMRWHARAQHARDWRGTRGQAREKECAHAPAGARVRMNGSSGSSGFSAYDADADYAALDEHARAIFDCWFGAP